MSIHCSHTTHTPLCVVRIPWWGRPQVLGVPHPYTVHHSPCTLPGYDLCGTHTLPKACYMGGVLMPCLQWMAFLMWRVPFSYSELSVGDYECRSAPTWHRPEVVLWYLDGGAGKEAWGWVAAVVSSTTEATDYYLLGYRLLPITEGHLTYSHIRIPSPNFLLKLTPEVPVSAFSKLINLPAFTYHNFLNSHP